MLHVKYKKCTKSIMDSAYVLWTYKIHCFIRPTNHIAGKFTLLLYIPYKGTYLYNIIERNPYKFCIEVTGSYTFSVRNLGFGKFCSGHQLCK